MVPSSPDVFVSLDAASPSRLGELAVLLDDAGTSVVVDHHASNPGFGDVRLVDGHAPATVTLVADLLDELGVTVDHRLATLLYAGLAADTGSFRFGNTRPDTHELAARLLATGIDHSDISRRLFDTAPFGWLGLLSVVTGRAVLEPDVGAGLVWTWSSTAEAGEHGLAGEQLEALVDVIRRDRGGRRRLRAQGPGRRLVVGVAALARRHRPRPGRARRSAGGTRARRRATAPTSTGRRRSRRSACELCGARAAATWHRDHGPGAAPRSGALDPRSLPRSVLALAVPALVVLAAEPLYLLVDTAVVGNLGTVPLGGLAVGGGLLAWSAALLNFLAYGTTARAARRAGAGDRAGAVGEGVQATWLALALGVAVLLLFQLLAGPLTRLLAGGAGPVAEAGEQWLRVASASAPRCCWSPSPATAGCAASPSCAGRCTSCSPARCSASCSAPCWCTPPGSG